MLGYDHESFWDQTAKTLSLTFDVANDRQIKEHNERAWLAWHIGALSRANRIPPLSKLQAKKQAAPTDWRRQVEDLKTWVVATGGKVVVRPREN